MLKKLLPETCTRNLHEKFDASSSQLASQSHCMVCVICQTVFVLEQSCAELHARNLYWKN